MLESTIARARRVRALHSRFQKLRSRPRVGELMCVSLCPGSHIYSACAHQNDERLLLSGDAAPRSVVVLPEAHLLFRPPDLEVFPDARLAVEPLLLDALLGVDAVRLVALPAAGLRAAARQKRKTDKGPSPESKYFKPLARFSKRKVQSRG